MAIRIKTTFGKTTRFFAMDAQGWHTTSRDKAKTFRTLDEADGALGDIKKAFKEIDAEIEVVP